MSYDINKLPENNKLLKIMYLYCNFTFSTLTNKLNNITQHDANKKYRVLIIFKNGD